MEFERKRYNHSHINIAPLVDVIFLLLLFFMLTSHLIREPAIKIRLPKSKTAKIENEPVKTITITRDGEVYFMEKRVGLNKLQMAIREGLKEGKADFLRIKADRSADIGILISVIDEVRLAGIRNYNIITERR